jgi:hypothetical protein
MEDLHKYYWYKFHLFLHKRLGYYNVGSCFFFFLSLLKEPVSDSTLDYKDFVNPMG